jgi:hypothetical protein
MAPPSRDYQDVRRVQEMSLHYEALTINGHYYVAYQLADTRCYSAVEECRSPEQAQEEATRLNERVKAMELCEQAEAATRRMNMIQKAAQ